MRHRRNVHDSHSFDPDLGTVFGCLGGAVIIAFWLCLIALPVLAVVGLLKWVF